MKVKFNQSVVGHTFHHVVDDVVELPESEARKFLKAGFCEAVPEPPKVRAKKAVKKSTSKQTR
tara:strand:+ start:75 stop:263 length:189 start_codon:yes stop_codon:yes gene_type:complete